MKRLIVVAIAVAALSGGSPLFAHLSGINLLSQTHEIGGATFFNGVLSEYEEKGSELLEGNSGGAVSRAGDFSVYADAFGDDSSNIGGAYARSMYMFRTESSDLNINLNGFIWFTIPETAVSYSLVDFTASSTLDTFTYSSNSGPVLPRDGRGNSFFSYDRTFTGLDIGHVYLLNLSSVASPGDGGIAVLNADLSSPVTVPLPSSLILGGVGFLLTGWLKRRKMLC